MWWLGLCPNHHIYGFLDCGSPENRGVLYVPVDEIVAEVRAHLEP
jgi:hypothetical protein